MALEVPVSSVLVPSHRVVIVGHRGYVHVAVPVQIGGIVRPSYLRPVIRQFAPGERPVAEVVIPHASRSSLCVLTRVRHYVQIPIKVQIGEMNRVTDRVPDAPILAELPVALVLLPGEERRPQRNPDKVDVAIAVHIARLNTAGIRNGRGEDMRLREISAAEVALPSYWGFSGAGSPHDVSAAIAVEVGGVNELGAVGRCRQDTLHWEQPAHVLIPRDLAVVPGGRNYVRVAVEV